MPNRTIVISELHDKMATIRMPSMDSFASAALSTRSGIYAPTKLWTGADLTQFREMAEKSEQVYASCPLIKSAVAMFIDLVFHQYNVRHEDQSTQDVFQKIFSLSNIEAAIEGILKDYFIYGNAFTYRFRGNGEIDPFDPKFDKFKPFMWTNLDPKTVDILGDTITDIQYALSSSSSGSNIFAIKSNTTIDPKLIYHIAAKKTVRERKADPFLHGLAQSVDLYNAYNAAETTDLSNPLPSFIHVTVGSTGPGGPKKHTITTLTNNVMLMKERSVLVTSDVVGVNPINIEDTRSASRQTLYANTVKQIEEGLGISRDMITSNVVGGGTLQWFNITKLVKTLEGVRRKIHKWLEREVKYIVKDLDGTGLIPKLTLPPTIKLDEISLRDEEMIRTVLLTMYERGIISAETINEECDLDFQVELNRKAFEKDGTFQYEGTEYKVSDILVPPPQPFQGQPKPQTTDTTNQTGNPNEQPKGKPGLQPTTGDPGGRPPGKSTPLSKPRVGA
jgi:hypothetical protein